MLFTNAVFSSQYFASNEFYFQSSGDSQVGAEIETSFSSPLSKPPSLNWEDLGTWDYSTTTQYGKSTIIVAPTSEYINVLNPYATTSPIQQGTPAPISQIPLNMWNFNHQLPIRQPHSTYTTPSEEPSFMSSDTNNAVAQTTYSPNYQTNYNRTGRYLHSLTPSPVANQTPPLFPKRMTKSKLKPKNLHCRSCERSFARAPDLQRHIDGIHLRIRHHCRVAGCGDNIGKGYCRMEKLRGHMMTAHGRV